MGDKHTILWMLLLTTLVWCAWWHTHENRQLTRRWKSSMDSEAARWLTRFAWSRSMQLIAALGICTLIIIVYDWQLSEAQNTINELNSAKAKPVAVAPERKPIPGNIALQSPTVTSSSATAAIPTPSYYPPAATKEQVQAAMAKTAQTNSNAVDESPTEEEAMPQSAPSTVNTNAVEDIYNPEQGDSSKGSKLDAIKKRYEDLLVTYFYLSKCNKADTRGYDLILSALNDDLAANHAPATMRNDILGAAQGSYQEVYATSACDPKTITPLYTQYNDYITSLTTPAAQ